MKHLHRTLPLLLLLAALLGCRAAPPPSPAPIPLTPSSTAARSPTPSPAPSATPPPNLPPTPTPKPSRTPKPTPTLPSGDDFACLPPDGERVSAVVAGVIDGDTITVQVGFQSFVIRYIGIDTPETNVQPPERMGPEATARNRELVTGERVTLVSDPIVGNTDRYSRLLRYVIVGDVFVNAQLVREGLARYYAGESACGALIFAAENEARSAHVGLWAPTPEP